MFRWVCRRFWVKSQILFFAFVAIIYLSSFWIYRNLLKVNENWCIYRIQCFFSLLYRIILQLFRSDYVFHFLLICIFWISLLNFYLQILLTFTSFFPLPFNLLIQFFFELWWVCERPGFIKKLDICTKNDFLGFYWCNFDSMTGGRCYSLLN